METETIEVRVMGDAVVRVEGLQRDRRRRNDLRITLPDGRVPLAHGRRPSEAGWEVYPEDESACVLGDTLVDSIAYMMGYEPWEDQGPEWRPRLAEALEGP
jgi:hypothetical protein